MKDTKFIGGYVVIKSNYRNLLKKKKYRIKKSVRVCNRLIEGSEYRLLVLSLSQCTLWHMLISHFSHAKVPTNLDYL